MNDTHYNQDCSCAYCERARLSRAQAKELADPYGQDEARPVGRSPYRIAVLLLLIGLFTIFAAIWLGRLIVGVGQ
jgi:hypothetical protein